jgi:hypothetical protein
MWATLKGRELYEIVEYKLESALKEPRSIHTFPPLNTLRIGIYTSEVFKLKPIHFDRFVNHEVCCYIAAL